MTHTLHTGWKLLAGAVFAAAAFVPALAFAQISVTAPNFPLNTTNMLPGTIVSEELTIANSDDDTASAYIEATNIIGDMALAEHMTLALTRGATTYYNGPFDDFLTAGSPLSIGNVSGNDDETYTFTLSLNNDTPQSFMGSSVGFDLRLILEGGGSITVPGGGNGGSGGSNPQYVPNFDPGGGTGGPDTPPPFTPPPFEGGVGGDFPFLPEASAEGLAGAGAGEEDAEETEEPAPGLFEDLGAPGVNDQAAAAGMLAGLMGIFDDGRCFTVFIFILLLLALAWRILENTFRSDASDARPFLARNRMGLLGLAIIAALAIYFYLTFPCIRWATVVAVILFAALMLFRFRKKERQ